MRHHDLLLRLLRLRSTVDFNIYLLRQRLVYLVGFVAVPFAVLPFFVSPGVSLLLGIAGLGVSVVSVADAKRKRGQEKHRLHLVPGEGSDQLREVRLRSGGTMVPLDGAAVAVWPDVDGRLLGQEVVPWAWSGRAAGLPPNLAAVAYDLLLEEYRKSGQMFNGAVVRQDDDLTTASFGRGAPAIHLSRTRYFDLLCSNYQTKWDVRGRRDVRYLEGRSLIVDSRGRLRDLAENGLANVVGVSTLAITTDGAVALVRQSSAAASSRNCLAPSGSGSMDLRDVPREVRRGHPPADDLTATLAAAMRRELVEEVNLSVEEAGRTHVTGYFRWLDQGGKPEYVGLTLLAVPRWVIEDREIRRIERAWVKDVVFPRRDLDYTGLADDPDSARQVVAEAAGERPEYVSVPLVMAVRMLGYALRRATDPHPGFTATVAQRCLGGGAVPDEAVVG